MINTIRIVGCIDSKDTGFEIFLVEAKGATTIVD
jgi:hypothetical protein